MRKLNAKSEYLTHNYNYENKLIAKDMYLYPLFINVNSILYFNNMIKSDSSLDNEYRNLKLRTPVSFKQNTFLNKFRKK